MIDINKCKIGIKINEKGGMLAQAEISFGDLLIYGFRVMQTNSGDKLFVTPPSIKSGRGNYVDIIRINNKIKWRELEDKIKAEYTKTKEEFDLETIDLPQPIINPDEIPF